MRPRSRHPRPHSVLPKNTARHRPPVRGRHPPVRPSPRGGRAPSRARRASPSPLAWRPEPRSCRWVPTEQSTRRPHTQPRLRAPELPVPHPRRAGTEETCECRREQVPLTYRAEPNLGGRENAAPLGPGVWSTQVTLQGQVRRPFGKPTPPRRMVSKTRYPVPGSWCRSGWSRVRGPVLQLSPKLAVAQYVYLKKKTSPTVAVFNASESFEGC